MSDVSGCSDGDEKAKEWVGRVFDYRAKQYINSYKQTRETSLTLGSGDRRAASHYNIQGRSRANEKMLVKNKKSQRQKQTEI